MAETVSAALALTLTVTQILDTANTPTASAPSISHNVLNVSDSLNAASTPAVNAVAGFTKPLSSGTATIDLTALVGTNGAAVSFNGKKVVAMRVKAPSANANVISFKSGASNGYNLGGNANALVSLNPGDEVLLYFKGNANPTVGGSTKTIDLAGTGTQSLEFLIVAG